MKAQEIVTLLVKSEGFQNVTIDVDKLAQGMKEIELEAKAAKGGIQMLKDENEELKRTLAEAQKGIKAQAKEVDALEKEYLKAQKAAEEYEAKIHSMAATKGYKAANAELKELTDASAAAAIKLEKGQAQLAASEAEARKYSATIKKNNEDITQLGYAHEYTARIMKTTDMTVRQLSERAGYLQGKLAATSQALEPDKWRQYQYQLLQVDTQKQKLIAKADAMSKYISLEGKSMDQLAAAADRLRNRLANMNKEMTPAAYAKASAMLNQVEAQMEKGAGPGEKYLKRIKITDMTMSQLSASAEYLRFRLANISKSLHPELWNKFNNQLKQVEAREKKVAAGGEQVKSRFDSIGNTIRKVLPLMIAYGALRMFQNAIQDVKEFIKKSIEAAAKAEGVMRAFNKLNDPNLLSTLRRETKGLISDLTLMQSAVRADKFGIPVNDLAKYLKFAQQRAQETGQSVEYLTESIVNGIGRKSKLIIDNLGISAAQLNDEIKKGASFAQAVTKIVDQELAKQGNLTLTSADKAQQAAVKWENAQLKVGNSLKWLGDKWSEFSGNVADGIAKMAGDSRTASQVFDDQNKRVADLSVNILPLIDRYDKLKKEVKLTYGQSKELDEEHQEMLDLVGKITSAMPHLRTEFDQYGRAIGFSTEEARKFIETQKAIMPYLYAKQLKEAKEDVEKYKEEIKDLNHEIERGKIVYEHTGIYTTTRFVPWEEGELAEKNAELAEFTAKLGAAERAVDYFTGNTAEKMQEGEQKIAEKRNEFTAMTNDQLNAWIKMHEKAAEKVAEVQDKFVGEIEVSNAIIETGLGKTKVLLDELSNSNPKDNSAELSLKKQLELARDIQRQRQGGGYGEGGKEEKESKITAAQKKALATRLENLENAHKAEILELRKYAFENNQTEEELKYETLKSDYKYYADRMQLVSGFLEEFQVTDEKFLADIEKMQADTRNSQFDLLPQFDANKLAELKKGMDEALQILDITKNAEIRRLQELGLTEEQYSARVQALELATAQQRLAILRTYHTDVLEAELQNGRLKEEAVKKSGDDVVQAESDVIEKRKALDKSFRDSEREILERYNLNTWQQRKDMEISQLKALYEAKKITTETYERVLVAITKKYEKEKQDIRSGVLTRSFSDEFKSKLAEIDEAVESGALTAGDALQARMEAYAGYAKKLFDTFEGYISDMVSAQMEAENAQIDAEYDVRIEAARGNAEEVERLEKEKAQKKLDIEKKYADTQFAIRASSIIANTAVAIMTAFWQLGPIAGAVAAAMLATTGAAQLAAANAERQKVKNMTLGGSSGEGDAKYERVLSTPKEEGGYFVEAETPSGKKYKAQYDPDRRGFVDKPTVLVGEGPAGRSREWVANNDAYSNPTIRPIIDLIDAEQRAGTVATVDMNRLIRARMAGLDTGGFIAPPTAPLPPNGGIEPSRQGGRRDLPAFEATMNRFIALMEKIEENGLGVNYQAQKAAEQKMKQYEDFGNKY
jgi:hypothetical protein